jgi:dihydroorotate dehydrogenase (fumarate)
VSLDRLQWTPRWELTPVDSIRATIAGIVQAHSGAAQLSIAASGGVRTAEDALQALIAGADVVMITSEIYRSGPQAISQIVQGVTRYLATRGFTSLQQLGHARPIPQPRTQQLQRLDYLDPLTASKNYRDPTPTASQQTGDQYGHRN